MVIPWLENVHSITDPKTGLSFACTAMQLDDPWEWRAAIVDINTRPGGIDARAGQRAYLKPRAITVKLIHVYGAGESFRTVMNAVEAVLVPGNPLTITSQDENGDVWLWENARCTKFDKRRSMDFAHYCEIPLTFTSPDPMQRALYKSSLNFLDNGLLLDNGWYLDDDPDSFALTGTTTTHTITNAVSGLNSAADEAPVVTLQGTIGGPVQVTYTDAGGNILYWYYTASIASGETITVDSGQLTVNSTAAGVNAYANFVLGGGQESWGRIAPGANTITVQCASYSGNAAAHVIWTNRK